MPAVIMAVVGGACGGMLHAFVGLLWSAQPENHGKPFPTHMVRILALAHVPPMTHTLPAATRLFVVAAAQGRAPRLPLLPFAHAGAARQPPNQRERPRGSRLCHPVAARDAGGGGARGSAAQGKGQLACIIIFHISLSYFKTPPINIQNARERPLVDHRKQMYRKRNTAGRRPIIRNLQHLCELLRAGCDTSVHVQQQRRVSILRVLFAHALAVKQLADAAQTDDLLVLSLD